jgi:hypothetical protein
MRGGQRGRMEKNREEDRTRRWGKTSRKRRNKRRQK